MDSRNFDTTSTKPVLCFDRGGYFDLGHPLLNRITESFVKAAGIGALRAAASEGYHLAGEGNKSTTYADITANNKKDKKLGAFPYLNGETNQKSLEAMVKRTGKESLQWGMSAGLYSGITYGLQEARGTHDWKNSAVAGAVTGMTVAMTCDEASHEQVLQCAITGAAISTAGHLLTGMF